MKKYLLLSILYILFLSSSYAQTTITGTVLGYDGKPIKMAHVSIYKVDNENSRVIAEVGKDGSYSISINEKGPYFLNYVGLEHNGESLLLATEDFANEKIDVTLELKKLYKSNLPNKVVGDFNNFNPLTAVEMVKQADSTFTATVETKEDKIKFIILVSSLSSTNGTQEAEYEFDTKRGLYLTVLKAVDGKVEIKFDPTKLPNSDVKASVKFEKESIISKVGNLYWAFNEVVKDYSNAVIGSMVSNKKNNYDLTPQIEKFEKLYEKENNPFVKQVILLLQAQVAGLLVAPNEEINEKISNKFISTIDYKSYLLKINPAQWIATIFSPRKVEISNEKARRGYVDEFIEKSTLSDEEKAKLVLSILQGAKLAYNEPVRKKYYDLMMSKYGDTKTAKRAKEFSDELKLVVGSPVPKFSLVSHDDPKVTFTNESFKGKKYLIDFWATWCGPCKAEMPELHKVYEKYKDKGFEILSISFDQSEDAINKYRKGEWKMPWLHTFVDGELKEKLIKDFDAAAIPKPFLVDGNTNKILALTTDLRGENLEKTLEKFLK